MHPASSHRHVSTVEKRGGTIDYSNSLSHLLVLVHVNPIRVPNNEQANSIAKTLIDKRNNLQSPKLKLQNSTNTRDPHHISTLQKVLNMTIMPTHATNHTKRLILTEQDTTAYRSSCKQHHNTLISHHGCMCGCIYKLMICAGSYDLACEAIQSWNVNPDKGINQKTSGRVPIGL